MKSILFLFVVVLLTSCGNQKIRLRRVQVKKQTVVKINDETRASLKSQKKPFAEEEEAIIEPKTTESVILSEDKTDVKVIELGPDQTEVSTSTVEEEPEKDEEKVAIALEAEKNAKRARGLLIGSLVGFFALIIPGVVLFIIGAIYYFKARNALYISEKGQRALELARIFFWIDLVLTSALIIGITGMIINNFL